MCGIVGLIDPAVAASAIHPLLHHMNNSISHRGPDDAGYFVIDGLGLGMRRLSIIDVAGGKQPVANEDGHIVVVFNGEIYNYQDLTAHLQQRGHTFKTASDTEVLVHLYEEVGDACVDHLRGMFSFALWDGHRRRLLLARDRLGIKPLYYMQLGHTLIFGSEIKSLLQHPKVRPSLNIEALHHFLSLKYVPAPQTMFSGIWSLPPGHTLTWDTRHGVTIRPYWDIPFPSHVTTGVSEATYAEQLEALLYEAVRLHLRSDVPFGAFLSGGIDSSLIVALMSQLLDEPVKTFSVGFDRQSGVSDELPYARLIAQRYQTEHHEIRIGAQDFVDLLEHVTWHLDQPIADQATVATYMVSKLAAQHVKMVLTGEGGDELFAGYARYAGDRLAPLFRYLPRSVKSLALALSQQIPGGRRPKIALYALCQASEATRLSNWFPLFNDDEKRHVLATDVQHALWQTTAKTIVAPYLARTPTAHALNRMLYVDSKLWLPDYLLLRGDKLTMAASLEARVPLLDHHLVEFAASLPPHLKLKGFTRKYLLKKIGQTLLPEDILRRKKAGFPIPIGQWLRHEARPLLRDCLAPDTLKRRGLFNTGQVSKMLESFDQGFTNHGDLLFGLLMVELWQRCFIDTPSSQPQSVSMAALT